MTMKWGRGERKEERGKEEEIIAREDRESGPYPCDN
jgi:hypothetical protein